MRPSDTPNIIDLMASSVIPLFYAFGNHKNLLATFLKQSPNQKEYLNACTDLYNALENQHQCRKLDLASLQDKEREIRKEISANELKTVFFGKEEGNNKDTTEEEKLNVTQKYEDESDSLEYKLTFIVNQMEKLRSLIANPINEIEAFLEEIRLYCVNPINGYENLENFFLNHIEIVKLLSQHQEIFKKVSEAWID